MTSEPAKPTLSPARIALVYLALSVAWITFSDATLAAITGSSNGFAQTVKGTLFVFVSTGLLYWMVRRLVVGMREAERARAATEQMYRTLFDTTGVGIGRIDAEGRIVYANPRLAAMAGLPVDQVLGRSFREFVHPDDLPNVERRIENRKHGISEEYDVRMRSVTGRDQDVLLSSTPIRHANGEFAGALAMLLDISERKRLESELQHSQKLDAVGRFAGSIAHDFNNVLGIIIGYASMQQSSLPEGSAREASDHIVAAANRGATLVRHLLAFSRKQVLNTDVVDLNAVVRSFGELLPRLMGEDVAVELAFSAGELPIRIGNGQVEQVLMNLAVNARDAMGSGGRLRIATGVEQVDNGAAEANGAVPGRYAVIRFTDTGAGIPQDVIPRIFEPFFTTKPASQGTGLGLSTVYGIVRQNGGFLRVDSELGAGTTFEVFLPCSTGRVSEPLPVADRTGDLRGSETVLLVEDEPALRVLTGHILRTHGYHVMEASEGDEALRIAADFPGPIDLLLTDMRMPGMSGRELAGRLLALRPNTAVAILSGYSDTETQSGANHAHLIEKPITPDNLLRKLRQFLDQRAPTNSEQAS